MKKVSPSIDQWLKEAKADPAALQEGMFLVHNGVVRQTPKAKVRQGINDGSLVKGLEFAYDAEKVEAIKSAIANGQFKVDSEKVADGLINSVKDLLSTQK